jgi:hypothetical protein
MSISIKIDGLPEAMRRVEGLTGRQMQNKLRRAVRAGAKPMQASLKAAAAAQPTGNLPKTFTKVPAAKVSASMRRGGQVVASVKPKSPLFNIFEPGAGAHEIAPGARGRAVGGLSGAAGVRGRKRAFYARGAVRHPGMRARPIRPTAFAAGKPAAQLAIARVLLESD